MLLVCSLSTPGSNCTETTALDVARGDRTSSASTCFMHAQAMIAPTAIKPAEDQYMKVVCRRGPGAVVAMGTH